MTEVRVTMYHLRKAKMCSRGARGFFKEHNLDWNEFITIGTPASVIVATGDAMALEVVEVANGEV